MKIELHESVTVLLLCIGASVELLQIEGEWELSPFSFGRL
jgi:hypothetical protein